jgi:hypothetical protein
MWEVDLTFHVSETTTEQRLPEKMVSRSNRWQFMNSIYPGRDLQRAFLDVHVPSILIVVVRNAQ